MSALTTLRRLLFGETWLLPLGLAAVLVVCALLRPVAGDVWREVGGFVLLAGVAAVLALSVRISARRR